MLSAAESFFFFLMKHPAKAGHFSLPAFLGQPLAGAAELLLGQQGLPLWAQLLGQRFCVPSTASPSLQTHPGLVAAVGKPWSRYLKNKPEKTSRGGSLPSALLPQEDAKESFVQIPKPWIGTNCGFSAVKLRPAVLNPSYTTGKGFRLGPELFQEQGILLCC